MKIFHINDIILLTEIWTNYLCDVSVDGFSIFQLNRVEKSTMPSGTGGIALYIKKSLKNYSKRKTTM